MDGGFLKIYIRSHKSAGAGKEMKTNVCEIYSYEALHFVLRVLTK